MKLIFACLILLFTFSSQINAQIEEDVVLGYFPSWSETWTSSDQNSSLREIPPFVSYVFLAFAKPNLSYAQGSYDISDTGIQVPYDGCTLKESIGALSNKGIQVILSVGGETYWGSPDAYAIDYVAIKDLVDDMGFVGIDWDYEPNGSFANIGSPENVQHFIDFFTNSREVMPVEEGYILACAPSGVGALGGVTNDDIDSPFSFANRNSITGENDDNLYNGTAQTNGINLFGFSASGHMIPVIESVGDKIDLIAFQGYNAGGSLNRSIMYDSYAHYAETYDFVIAAGVHFPDEPWGPYYEYTHENIASLSSHINTHFLRSDDPDGIMIWQLLLEEGEQSAFSYLNVASMVLNGTSELDAISTATDFSMAPYTGGADDCVSDPSGDLFCGSPAYNAELAYTSPGIIVYYDCQLWTNQWYANPNEMPSDNPVWIVASECTTCDCDPDLCDFCFGDANQDGVVNTLDLVSISSSFGCTESCFGNGDANFDGEVNVLDYVIVSTYFGMDCF